MKHFVPLLTIGLLFTFGLTAAGYAVLAVDSPGVGDSSGAPASNRDAVVASVQVWFDWLATQPEVQTNSIAMLGASIGGLQALVGCGAMPECRTAISLSPPRDGYGITAEQVREALETQLRNRSALLLAATFDGYFTAAVREMAGWSRGELGVYIFRGVGHGEMLFTSFERADRVIAHILDWLNEHRPSA